MRYYVARFKCPFCHRLVMRWDHLNACRFKAACRRPSSVSGEGTNG